MHKFINDEKGSMAEADVTTPVIILLMVAIVNLGMLMYVNQAAENAANYGARRGSVAQNNAAAVAYAAANEASQGALIGEYEVTITAPGGIVGSTMAVQVDYTVPNLLRGLSGLFPGLPSGEFSGNVEATFRQEGW